MAVHRTGRSIGNEITVNSELPLPALETIAPSIVVIEAIAKHPDNTVKINSRGYTGKTWRKKRYRAVTTADIERKRIMLKISFEI
jgi:hypothetical protein